MTSVTAPVDMDSLRHAQAWPVDALAFDPESYRFLSCDELGELDRGAEKARRHGLVFRPISWVVPGVVCEGYNVLSAPPKVGKTRLAHQLLMSVDMGSDWLGREVRQGPALFIALEDTLASLTERERALLGYDEDLVSQGVG